MPSHLKTIDYFSYIILKVIFWNYIINMICVVFMELHLRVYTFSNALKFGFIVVANYYKILYRKSFS